jgi:sulfur-carrier protein
LLTCSNATKLRRGGQALDDFDTSSGIEGGGLPVAFPNDKRQQSRFALDLSYWPLAAARAAKENPQGFAVRYNSCVATVSQSVRVKVLFFGRLKDIVGHAEESLDLADAPTIEGLFARYSASVPELAKYRSSVVASRNQEFAPWDTVVYAGDEVAFLPPVSGG